MLNRLRASLLDFPKQNDNIDKRVHLVNILSTLGLIIGVGSLPFDWYHAPLWMVVEDIIAIVVFIAIPLLNRMGKTRLTRILFLALCNFILSVDAFLLGTQSGVDLMMFGFSAFGLMLFDLKEKFNMAFWSTLPIVVYFWINSMPEGFALDPLKVESYAPYATYSAIMAFTCIVMSVYFLQKVNQSSEAALRESRVLMINSEKMAALGEMSGNLAHEINTPLAAMRIQASILKKLSEAPEPNLEKIAEKTKVIDSLIERTAAITVFLQNFARNAELDPLELTPVDLIVNDTLNLCQEKFRVHGVDLHILTYDSPRLTINCRAVQISQVLLNLLNNSFSAVSKLDEKWVQLRVSEEGKWIRVSVTDSGPGIPEDIQEKLFQPFFTTKARGLGTGLGLSISKRIVDSHGGRIYFDPTSANTRFVFEIPTN